MIHCQDGRVNSLFLLGLGDYTHKGSGNGGGLCSQINWTMISFELSILGVGGNALWEGTVPEVERK